MNRLLRIAAIGTASLTLLFAIAAVVVLILINPNDYKPLIETTVLEATGKKLQLQGELSLSLFPKIRIEAGPALMEDDPSFGPGPFLSVEKASAAVALMPLFSGKAEISTVAISGVRLKLAVNESGMGNWNIPGKSPDAFLQSGQPGQSGQDGPALREENSPPRKTFSLASVALDALSITDAVISYLDIPTGKNITVAVKELECDNLRVGQKSNIGLNGVITGLFTAPASMDISASFNLPAALMHGSRIEAEGSFADVPFSFQGFLSRPGGVSLTGEASFGDINIDTFTMPPNGKKAANGANGANGPDSRNANRAAEEKTVEILRDLFLDLHIKARSVIAGNVPLKNITATIKGDQGVITAKPVYFTVFGPVNVEASLDARGAAVTSRASGKMESIAVGPLLQAAGGKIPLTGTLNATWNVNATGLSWPSVSKSLNGKAAFTLSNGNLPAFQLIPANLPGLPATTIDLANIQCSSTWEITDGIASNSDMKLRSTAINGKGEGKINIPGARIDYTMVVSIPTIKELPDLKILPITVTGPLASPSYGIDQPALVKETVKKVLDPSGKVGKEVEKEVGKALRKLF